MKGANVIRSRCGPRADRFRYAIAVALSLGIAAVTPDDVVRGMVGRELSALFTAALSPLHTLAAANVEGAQASLDEARAYTALRLDRDMRSVFAMEGGLLGKG